LTINNCIDWFGLDFYVDVFHNMKRINDTIIMIIDTAHNVEPYESLLSLPILIPDEPSKKFVHLAIGPNGINYNQNIEL